MRTKRLICTAVFLLLFMCHNALAQGRITLNLKEVPLREAFAAVEKASNYTFFYDAQNIDTGARVSVNVKDADIEKALGSILEGTGITFTIKGRQIALIPPPPGF